MLCNMLLADVMKVVDPDTSSSVRWTAKSNHVSPRGTEMYPAKAGRNIGRRQERYSRRAGPSETKPKNDSTHWVLFCFVFYLKMENRARVQVASAVESGPWETDSKEVGTSAPQAPGAKTSVPLELNSHLEK